MSIPGSVSPLLLGAAAGSGGSYQISRSLRFNSADSAYLSRTPAQAGNRKTWTWSGWVKRSELGQKYLFRTSATSAATFLYFNSSDRLHYWDRTNGADFNVIVSNARFRDLSAWYHVVLAVNFSDGTPANRARFYVNGNELSLQTANYPATTDDTYANSASVPHLIGGNGVHLDGYLADIHFIDGQALTPSSFGQFDANGEWQPKAYTGTYGTNGFRLDFADNSAATATTLGKDTSGNGNNWTPNNLSVAAGAGNDSLVDTPTSYGTDTDAGGEVRGNYATLNPLHSYVSLASNGNLDCNSNGSGWIGSTIHVTTGKWYVEFTVGATGTIQMFGVCTSTHSGSEYPWQASAPGVTYYVQDGRIYVDGVNTGTTTASTSGDIISLSFDVDAKSVVVRKNNSVLSTKTIGTTSSYMFYISDGGGNATSSINFGQRPFAYTAPSGFKALCDTNLPAPVVAKPSTAFDVKLYTGNGGTQTISGLGFSPDLVWTKNRTRGTANHAMYDTVRGRDPVLASNTAAAELTGASSTQDLTSFNSDGFSLGTVYNGDLNRSTEPYVAWAWDAGSSTVTNTQGSITSSVRANASAGFSIVTYTGTGANATVGHGLGVAPSLIIVKQRTNATTTNWAVRHSALANTEYLLLNTTAAKATGATYWNSSSPTNSNFSLGTAADVNANNGTYVAYLWAPVSGYSAFGSYTGNGSTDGPFVFTNMRPRWILVKRTDTTGNWTIIDTARLGYNVDNNPLYPNLADAEGTADLVDILSNGFKLRSTDASVNANTGAYAYAALAEFPFAYARAR